MKTIDKDKLEKATNMLGMLDLPTNQNIITYLLDNPGSSVMKMYKILKLVQSDTSTRLKNLCDADILFYLKDGNNHLYYVNKDRLDSINTSIKYFINNSKYEIQRKNLIELIDKCDRCGFMLLGISYRHDLAILENKIASY